LGQTKKALATLLTRPFQGIRGTFVKFSYFLTRKPLVLNLQVGSCQQRRRKFLYRETDCLSGRVKAPIMYPPACTNFGREKFRRSVVVKA